jgi:site-specific recombinase XerD
VQSLSFSQKLPAVARKAADLSKCSPTILEFAASTAVSHLSDLDTNFLREYRQSWKLNATSSTKQTERLKSFFKFCVDQKWIGDNPASALKPPIGSDDMVPVIPFTKPQFAAIMKACGSNEYLKTFVLVMRYSGLATAML